MYLYYKFSLKTQNSILKIPKYVFNFGICKINLSNHFLILAF